MYPWELHTLFLLFVSFVIYLVIVSKFKRPHTAKQNLPPSPPKLPIIGNLHQLGLLPHRTLRTLSQKHGPLMFLQLGQTPALIVSSAESARECMKTQDLLFSNRPKMSFADRFLYSKDLTFSKYGEYWRQVRKVSILHLLSAQRVKSFHSVREEETALMIQTIRTSCSFGLLNLSEKLITFANDVTCRAAFGRKFSEKEGGARFWKMLSEFMYFIGVFNVADFIPWLAWVNILNGFNKRVEQNFKDMDFFLEGVIQEHIQSSKRNEHGGEVVEDFVDVLLRIEKDCSIGVPFDKDSIKAMLLDIFAAGTDTASATLVWAMTQLIKHPEIMKEAQMEIRIAAGGAPTITEDDLPQMHYLKMVIKETLRLHPPAPLLVPRETIQATKLQGYDIPAKCRVIVNAWAIGRDPICWEDPEEFFPRRFMNTSVDYNHKGQDFEMLPFGAGRRGCPGASFAIPNMELPLANLLYHFDWSLPDGTTVGDVDFAEGSGIIAHKISPLLLIATPHTPEGAPSRKIN